MTNIFPIDFEEKLTMAQDDYILFSDSEDWNKIKKAQYKNLKGEKGDPWTAATIAVGSVSTLPAWSSVTVTNSWTSTAAVLDFWIPEWDKWDTWDWATIAVWTVSTLPAWSSATVTNVGTSTAAVFDFGIPQGTPGTWSWDVSWPASSTGWHLAVFDWATWKIIKDWWAMPTIPTKVSDLSNDSGFITWINSGDVTTALWYTPADSASLGTAASKNTWTSSGNVPVLDSNWKLATSTLPWVALTDTFTVSTSSDLTSLSSADQWDIAIVTTENKTYVLSQAPYSTAANWKQILSPTWWVTSWNGQTWAVTYSAPVSSVNGSTWAVTVSEFAPWGTATTGYVVTKTASGYEWSAPSWWDVMVSSQSWNILTSWMKIWAWTQSDYENLWTYDSNTVYLTI